jgi:MFS family permease
LAFSTWHPTRTGRGSPAVEAASYRRLISLESTTVKARNEPLGINFRKLWMATGISSLGDGIRETVIPLLAASITRDPLAVAMITVAGSLPWLIFSLISGVVVDRLDRKRLMWRVDAFRAAVMCGLGVAVVTGWARLPLLAVVAFLIGTGETLFQNAWLAILPSVVAKDQLERANSRLYSAEIVSRQFSGPPIGSFLFAAAVTLPFFLDAASFALSFILILSLRGSFQARGVDPGTVRPSMRSEIWEGLDWLWRQRLLRTLALMLGVWNLFGTATLAIFVLYALEILRLHSATYGVLLTTFAAGSLIGSFAARRVGAWLGTGATLLMCISLGAVSAGVLGLTSSALMAGAMMALEGAVGTMWNILTISLRQAIIPDRLLGRVSSVYRLVGLGVAPIGALLGGLLARPFGLRFPFLLTAGCLALMAVLAIPILGNESVEAARAAAVE